MIRRWWRHLIDQLAADEAERATHLDDPATREAWLAGYRAGLRDGRWLR